MFGPRFTDPNGDGIDHFRWPFGRTYPLNPELDGPPIFYTYVDPVTKQSEEREIYRPLYSLRTYEQMEADERWGNILKVAGTILVGASMITLGYYLKR